MKELTGTARNLALVKESQEYEPVVELIFVVTEPVYNFAVNEMVRERVPETIRISTNLLGIRRLIDEFVEIESELKTMHKDVAKFGQEAENG